MTSGGGYALDLASVVSYVAATLDGAAPAALSVRELASTYHHPNPGDLARVREHESAATNDEAVEWLISRAISELRYRTGPTSRRQIEYTDGAYRLADGLILADLRWKGAPVYAVRNVHAQLRDAFNPMSGRFSEDVRRHTGKDSMAELRESMRSFGWIPELPAIKDERGVVLVGHRRLRIAEELGIEPAWLHEHGRPFVTLGDGDAADARRFAIAIASNLGAKPLTPEERKGLAEYLYGERKWAMARIAEALKVSQATITGDLVEHRTLSTVDNVDRLDSLGRKASPGRPRNTVRPRHPKTPEIRTAVRPFVEVDRPVPQKQLAEDHGVERNLVQRITAEERIRFEAQQETATALAAADDEKPAAETEPAEQCRCTCCPH